MWLETPFGAYVEAVRSANLVFLSGMLPIVDYKPKFIGRVGGELTIEDGRKAAATACLSALSAAKAFLGSLDKVTGVAKLGVFIATEANFREHPRVTDGASEILMQVFGTAKLSSRVVVGIASCHSGCRSNWNLFWRLRRNGPPISGRPIFPRLESDVSVRMPCARKQSREAPLIKRSRRN